jgi:hypothetical protein
MNACMRRTAPAEPGRRTSQTLSWA